MKTFLCKGECNYFQEENIDYKIQYVQCLKSRLHFFFQFNYDMSDNKNLHAIYIQLLPPSGSGSVLIHSGLLCVSEAGVPLLLQYRNNIKPGKLFEWYGIFSFKWDSIFSSELVFLQ